MARKVLGAVDWREVGATRVNLAGSYREQLIISLNLMGREKKKKTNKRSSWGKMKRVIFMISVENCVSASAFRDVWARAMFLKFSKLHEP